MAYQDDLLHSDLVQDIPDPVELLCAEAVGRLVKDDDVFCLDSANHVVDYLVEAQPIGQAAARLLASAEMVKGCFKAILFNDGGETVIQAHAQAVVLDQGGKPVLEKAVELSIDRKEDMLLHRLHQGKECFLCPFLDSSKLLCLGLSRHPGCNVLLHQPQQHFA